FSRAVGGIQRVANAAGYNVVICQSDESYPAEKKNLDSLISNHVDGLLISVSRETQNSDHFLTLLERNIPVVFFDRVCESLETPQVITDNYEISFKATQHLIDQGCRKIAILAGPEYLSTSSKRVCGYRAALMQNNIGFNPAWLLFPDFRCNSIEAFTNELLRQKDFPDAIFAINDMAAIEIMHFLKKSGLKIPSDVAVMGFNNEKVGEFMEPSLSSIDLPAQEMGETAAEILINHIKDPECKPEKRLIASRLVIRSSTVRNREAPESKIP
ncbi:MAG: substrate-binding domain-containing protein, partial [Bacteroidota bacterium]|nr:substrate-binding domain-containing protein [Bacteroidota bacterium]